MTQSDSYHVIIAGRNLDKVNAALAEIKGTSGVKGTLSALQIDVTDKASITAAAQQVEKDFGRVDALLNNAGVSSTKDTVAEQLEDVLHTNVIGPARVSETFLPLLLKSKTPYSIYTSSGLGSIGLAADTTNPWHGVDAVAYRMSKSALNMLAVQEAKLLGKQGVKVVVMCPGLVESNLRGTSEEARSAGGQAEPPEVSAKILLSIIEGNRDGDVGKFVWKDGVYPW